MGRVSSYAFVVLLATSFGASAQSGSQPAAQPGRQLPPTRSAGGATTAAPIPAQAKPAPAAAPRTTAAPSRTTAVASKPRLPDAQVEAVIRAKFAKSKLAPDKLTVRVQGGVATIEGRTDIVQHKGNATRMAKTAGAVAVNNHVVVSDAAKQKAAGNLEDGRRRAQIKRGDARGETPDPSSASKKKNQ